MAAPRKYPDEVRERAIRLVRDLVDDEDEATTVTGACRRIGEQLHVPHGLDDGITATAASGAFAVFTVG